MAYYQRNMYQRQPARPAAPRGPASPHEARVVQSVGRLNYADKGLVTHQLVMLSRSQPHLVPSEEHYVSDTGKDDLLVKMEGTIPTVHQGHTYHTPLKLYIPLRFPHEAPIVFVPPAAGMHVSPSHSVVTRSGRVRVNWHPSMMLEPYVKDLASKFGAEPPLHRGRPQPQVSDLVSDASDTLSTLARRVYKKMHDQYLVELQRGLRLNERTSKLEASTKDLERAKAALTQHLSQLESVAAASGGEAKVELDAETVVERQVFDLVAKVLAVEDTIFELDKAVENDVVTVGDFVKSVRRLARDQFEARALVQKIFHLQRHAAQAGGAATASSS